MDQSSLINPDASNPQTLVSWYRTILPLIFKTSRSVHVIPNPTLHFLHWLPTELRINYKLSLLCFKIISHQAPMSLLEPLHLHTPFQQLSCSADIQMFRIPSVHTKSSGQCSSSYQAPTNWNQLPVSVHHSTSVHFFQIFIEFFLSFQNLLFSPIAIRYECVCVCVCARACVRVRVCVCACVCVCVYSCCMHWILTICICKERVSA